jgi:predicted enzyme related to lactoylglutathione lyase
VELSGSVTREADVMTGEPSYIELGVHDADAARAFYGRLLGCKASGGSGPGQSLSPPQPE